MRIHTGEKANHVPRMCLEKPAPSAKIKTKELQGIKIPILGSNQNADKPDRDPSNILGTRGIDRKSIQISTPDLMVEKTDIQNNYKKQPFIIIKWA